MKYFSEYTSIFLDSRLRGNDNVEQIPSTVYPHEGGEGNDSAV
jgi:hypothetical protein